ncbi:MAG TPA: hypothetical protein VMG32_14070 [Anaeromyxobacteraceae bacterium]|nr:hypothetical protein [Anaeromyxobacteraceae bacterium]
MTTTSALAALALALAPLAAWPDEVKATPPAHGAQVAAPADAGKPAPPRRRRKSKAVPKAKAAGAAKSAPRDDAGKPCEEVKPCPIE